MTRAHDDAACAFRIRVLRDLVTTFLEAERLHRSAPCLHRYRGIVRKREVAKRFRRYREARTALESAVNTES